MILDSYVGLPWKDKGRDRDGLDCWGLVCLVYREQLGIELPSLSDLYATASDRALIADLVAGQTEPWVEVREKDVRPLDGVLMRSQGAERHMGLVARRGQVLHIGGDLGFSRIERYGSCLLRWRVSRFMRYIGDERACGAGPIGGGA